MKIIVPCCGQSSRFPGQPPKWTLPAHDGRPMICLALSKLKFDLDQLVVTILQEHEQKYHVVAGLEKAFGRLVRTVVLEERTTSQSETVAKTLQALQLKEPFFVKDSDGVFQIDEIEQPDNYVCVDSLNNFDSINPRNKSYLQVDHKGLVTNIREKVVISDLFNVGGYYFTSSDMFLDFYERMTRDKAQWNRELYLSDVIGSMILEGVPFRARQTTGFSDWGTLREWRRALLAQKAYFVLLDGFVFERGSDFFRPRFQDTAPNPQAVEAVRSLAAHGHKIVYLSIRPKSLSDITQLQINAAALPQGQILWDCPIAKWVVLTSPHSTMPFQTSRAIEVHPDEVNLIETINDDSFI